MEKLLQTQYDSQAGSFSEEFEPNNGEVAANSMSHKQDHSSKNLNPTMEKFLQTQYDSQVRSFSEESEPNNGEVPANTV
jgi:hypothetical protein